MTTQDYVGSGRTVNVASANEENALSHVDFRLLENRREWLVQWFAVCTAIGDVDPAIWAMNYLNERYEYSLEERYWFAWLYHTYHLPQAFVYKNDFPDEELASVERFESWTNENYSRLTYQTDTKWSKGHLAAMYASYRDWVGDESQHSKFTHIANGSPTENFTRLWDLATNRWYKFGRYTTYFYLQQLKHTCGLNIEPPGLFLSDYSGSKSHRNGLCFAAGKDDWVNQKLTPKEYSWLEGYGASVLFECKERFPELAPRMDFFALETALCSAKKLWREKNGRYVGYYLDRQSEEIMKAESKKWDGIEWEVMWQARSEVVGEKFAPYRATVSKEKMGHFLQTGQLHYYYQSLLG